LKFLVYANSPDTPTGYGVQCKHLITRLKRDGHDVAVACTYGHQIGVKQYATPYGPVTLYPSGRLENSLDILRGHAEHFFEGDHEAGWILPLTDMWVLNRVPLDDFKVLAWTPVDHFPTPEAVVKFFHKSGATPVAMSRFGERMLIESGLDPLYAPLAVDTSVYKPTFKVAIGGEEQDARTVYGIPQGAFAVLMVAMNKDPKDRKGFNEAFRAFGAFWRDHQESVLVVHSDRFGMDGSGIDLVELAKHAEIPPHALIFTDAYAQRIGFSPEMMAGLYTAADVLLAPSRGEGFGVPMVEAQACGTPVIATDFTAQSELIGAGWGVTGQLEWDAPQSASYLATSIVDIYNKLHDAYKADHEALSVKAQAFAAAYDVDAVWDTYWRPLLAGLERSEPPADKPLMEWCDVIVPLMRNANRERFESSLWSTGGTTVRLIVGEEGKTYAQNVNACLAKSSADWVLVVGDDCEFTPGWFEAAQALSDRYDVVGTNDSEPGRIRNQAVAKGSHADHFFIRRSYVDDEGSTLDGPGVAISEAYEHWYSDKEVIELAKARGVYGHAHECRIIHHHPGYDGDEAAREADPLYMRAVERSDADRKTWMSRVPIIAGYKAGRS
jgi:glycosyltransferase involved in cell wall biosynthesis